MKKHIAFKIMLPLIVIFILTVTVNVSTTSQFQSFREVCEGMSNTTTEVPQEIRDTAGSMAEGITAGLSRNGVISAGNGYCNDYRNVCFGCKAAAEDTKTAQRYD